jgi:hypothetical protein
MTFMSRSAEVTIVQCFKTSNGFHSLPFPTAFLTVRILSQHFSKHFFVFLEEKSLISYVIHFKSYRF